LPWQFYLIKESEIKMLEQNQFEDLSERVTAAVGLSKLQALSPTQAQMCEVMLTERPEKVHFQPDQIKDAELVRIYEMVVDHLLPFG
jgi:hypothetical protein